MAGDFPNLDVITISRWPEPAEVPPTRSWFSIFSVTLTVISATPLCSRIWIQTRKYRGGLRLDDRWICIGWLFLILYTASCIAGTLHFGFDRHIWDVEFSSLKHAALTQWLGEASFLLSMCSIKISVLLFYKSLDIPYTRGFRRLIYFFIALTAIFTVACLFTQILICHPTASYWAIPESNRSSSKQCASQSVFYPVQGALESFSTLYTIGIPFLALRNLPMVQSRRTGLRVIATAALSVVAFGIVRAYYLSILANSHNGDATWNGFDVFVWSQIELHFALIFASLPFLYCHFTKDPAPNSNLDAKSNSISTRAKEFLLVQIKRFHSRKGNARPSLKISAPTPPAMEIPHWGFEALKSPRHTTSPVDEIPYEQYILGKFGPPAPPKDSRALFDQYRREHGEIV